MARRQGPYVQRWCFTIPNPTQQGDAQLQALMNNDQVTKMITGFEIGEGGLRHYQGYIEFEHAHRRNQVLHLLGRGVHVEPARGSREANLHYCSKGGDIRFMKGRIDRVPQEQRKMNWAEMVKDARVMMPAEFEAKWPRIWFLHRHYVEKLMVDEAKKTQQERLDLGRTRNRKKPMDYMASPSI
jgi:hypothetical protein